MLENDPKNDMYRELRDQLSKLTRRPRGGGRIQISIQLRVNGVRAE